MSVNPTRQRAMKEFRVREVFGFTDVPAEATVLGYADREPEVPEVDPVYIHRREVLSDIECAVASDDADGLLLFGPTGSGKSTGVVQYCAALNIPLYSVTAHSRMETPELFGRDRIVNGNMIWVDGPLTLAMKRGAAFLLDEVDLLDPATAAGLNPVLEGRPVTIVETGETIHPAEGFRFFATANTNMGGDTTGRYQGTLQQNAAFADRFMLTEVGYATPEQELAILLRAVPKDEDGKPAVPKFILEKMIEFANDVRKLFMGAGERKLEITMSTRTLIRWAKKTHYFSPLEEARGINPFEHALDRALGFRAAEPTRLFLRERCQRSFARAT